MARFPSDETRPASISIAAGPPQPIPAETLVDHRPDSTAIARSWEPGDAADCRLCPRDRCYVSPRGNCLVTIEGFVPTVLAPLWPFASPGLPRSTTAGLGAGLRLRRPGGQVADR